MGVGERGGARAGGRQGRGATHRCISPLPSGGRALRLRLSTCHCCSYTGFKGSLCEQVSGDVASCAVVHACPVLVCMCQLACMVGRVACLHVACAVLGVCRIWRWHDTEIAPMLIHHPPTISVLCSPCMGAFSSHCCSQCMRCASCSRSTVVRVCSGVTRHVACASRASATASLGSGAQHAAGHTHIPHHVRELVMFMQSYGAINGVIA